MRFLYYTAPVIAVMRIAAYLAPHRYMSMDPSWDPLQLLSNTLDNIHKTFLIGE
jgi:hypothetical protein